MNYHMISRNELNRAILKYKKLVHELPDDLAGRCPIVEEFFAMSRFHTDIAQSLKMVTRVDCIELTEKGQARYDILMSPYATTLFRLWVLFGDKPDE